MQKSLNRKSFQQAITALFAVLLLAVAAQAQQTAS